LASGRTLPDLGSLHLRHPGLTQAVCAYLAEAAAVCLSRHHSTPIQFTLTSPVLEVEIEVSWPAPDQAMRDAHNNADDATRDGAYAVSLAATEEWYGLRALKRAETRTGADYYVGLEGQDFEDALRLEVSGVDRGDDTTVNRRLRAKVEQARRGASNLPAMAAVVGFEARLIATRAVQ